MGDFASEGEKPHKKEYWGKTQVLEGGYRINSHYDAKSFWIISEGGHTCTMEINGYNNHFAAKHLIFSGDNDNAKLVEKLPQTKDPVRYLTIKAMRRLTKRNTPEPDPGSANADVKSIQRAQYEQATRRRNKYGTEETYTACMLNMKAFQGMPYILKEAAADKIAKAFRDSGQEKGVLEVEVDFQTNCVITVNRDNSVKFGSRMKITGSFEKGYSRATGGLVKLFHAVTTGLPQRDNPN